MAVIKGIPGAQTELSSAVRKAIFSSVAATAMAVGAPGSAVAAEVACTPADQGMPSAGDMVTCTGTFDESINYDVVDTTVVDPVSMEESVVAGDVSVVLSETSSTSGINVTSVTAAAVDTAAQGSVAIENNGDITQSADSEMSVDPALVQTFTDRAIREGQRSGMVFTGTGELVEGSTWQEDKTKRSYFSESMTSAEITEYLVAQGIDATVVADAMEVNGVTDREESIDVIVAPVGTFDFDDVAGISAETEEGNIDVVNNGSITMGDGLSVTYYTRATELDSNPLYPPTLAIDTDGDGIRETILLGETAQVFLSGKNEAKAYTVGINAESTSGDISVENAGSITTGNISVGMRANTVDGDIDISNSGDIVAGDNAVGISASSAAQAELAYQYGGVESSVYYLAGRGRTLGSYVHDTVTTDARIYLADGSDSNINIDNSGSITVGASGTGIEAQNPSGDAITISNSGDITVGAGEGGVGISASAVAGFETQYSKSECVPGAFFGNRCATTTYTEDGTAPNADDPDFNSRGVYYQHSLYGGAFVQDTVHHIKDTTITGVGYVDDGGDIVISNSGNIDMSATTDGIGIHAQSYGSINIDNSGNIAVGEDGRGIYTEGVAETTVVNSGDIDLQGGGESTGIHVRNYMNPQIASLFGQGPEMSAEERYGAFENEMVNEAFGGFNGGVEVTNSGTISGGNSIEDVLEFNENGTLANNPLLYATTGIDVHTTGANMKGTDIGWHMYGQESIDAWVAAGGSAPELRDSVELFDTNVHNSGDILLGDLSKGILASATYGEVTVTNSGTVSVGDGFLGVDAESYGPRTDYSAGISAVHRGTSWAHHNVHNTETGVVTTGDMGQGLVARSVHGDAYVLNEGYVKVGSGATVQVGDEGQYDFVRNSTGISAGAANGLDNHASAVNAGEVVTGDHAVGMQVVSGIGPGFITSAFDAPAAAVALNDGSISTGDNSQGMVVGGISVYALNTGDISIGSGDFQSGTSVSHGAGMSTYGGFLANQISALVNEGSITTGDETAGINSEAFTLSVAAQGENGSIVTGNDSYGLRSVGYVQATAQNQGSISSGDDSFGMHSFAIFSSAVNSGDVNVGDNSTGMNVVGAAAYAVNTGDINVGEDSTGIYLFSGATSGQIINEGSVTSAAGGTAIEVAGDHDSVVVNAGSIEGSVVTGAGNDFLYNTVQTDANGNVVAAGSITLSDDTIDLGAGTNLFYNVFGDIIFSGESTIELGDAGSRMDNFSVQDSYVTINSANGMAGDTLTINGDVNFNAIQSNAGVFFLDVSNRNSDRIVFNGDVTAVEEINAQGDTRETSLAVVMNTIQQEKGNSNSGQIVAFNGEENIENLVLAGITGDYAETVLSAELKKNNNGKWVISYVSGLSDLGTAAASVGHMADSFFMDATGAFMNQQRNQIGLEAGRTAGVEAWVDTFHRDNDVDAEGDLAAQAMGFTQMTSGSQLGATWTGNFSGGWLQTSAMFGSGTVSGAQMVQDAHADLDVETAAVSFGFGADNFQVDAMYMAMEFDASIDSASSDADTTGNAYGYAIEGRYIHKLESGLALTPFARYADVNVNVDGFRSSDGAFDYDYDLGNTSQLNAGVNLSKSFLVSDGVIAPYMALSYVNKHNADDTLTSNGVSFGSDTSGSGTQFDVGINGVYKKWTVSGGVGLLNGDVEQDGMSARFSVNRSW